LVLALTGTLALGFTAGALLSPRADATSQPSWETLQLFGEVFDHIRERYVEPADDEQLVYAALRGMVGALDPHSRFMDPAEFTAMQEDTRGQYVGVGMQLLAVDEGVEVEEVFAGGPAADAGILPGDLILGIDGESALGWTTDQAVAVLRGQRGVAVVLDVRREDEAGNVTELTFNVVRDVVRLVAVESSMPVPGYAVIRVREFQEGVSNDVRSAIDRLQSEHGNVLHGMVLDLRGNPGGLLSEAISLSDVFLDDGTIVSTAGRDEDEDDAWQAQRSDTRYRGPLVVLVDQGSASASEIVAGALQDNRRAVTLGTRTYGKGSVQSIIELEGGAGLKLTVALYYTPSGRSIQNYGITPDFTVEAGEIDPAVASDWGEAALEGTLENPNGLVIEGFDLSAITDRQLRAGLEQLHAFSIFTSAAQ
jgi:carboxyl-terminal processing protease